MLVSGTLLAIRKCVVFSLLRIFPAPKQYNQVIELLRSVQDLTRHKPCCIGCWVSNGDPLDQQIRYVEQWDSEEALHEHIRSHLYLRILEAMELSKQLPEIKFYYSAGSKGFELIEGIRGRSKV